MRDWYSRVRTYAHFVKRHMSKMLKYVVGVIAAAVVIAAVFTAGRRTAKAPTAESKEPYKIGVIAPLTGDAAAYGEPLSNVLRMAASEINAEGGADGHALELIFEDGKCNGKDAASAAQKLVNVDKAKIIIGGFCSSESLAAVPIAAQAKAFLFSPGSSSPDLTGIDPHFARNYPSDAAQGQVLAGVAYDDKQWKKVAFIQEQLDYPLGIYKAFSAAFEAKGGTVVKEEFASNSTDFRSQLTKLRAQKPGALFVDTQTPAAAERILKQLQDLAWKVPLLVADVVPGDAGTVQRNAAVLEGALGAEFGTDPQNAKFQHLLSAYQAAYGAELPFQSYGQTMYDAIYMVRDALKNVGYDGEMVATWVRMAKNWEGASGGVTIGQDGDRASGHVPKVIKGGKVELYVQ